MPLLFHGSFVDVSRLKQLGRDSIVYGIGGMLAKSVSFFTLPIYTRIFTPADYGTIEMLLVLSNFLGAILVMGMDSAQSMYFFKYKIEGKAAQARIVSSILQWRLLWGRCRSDWHLDRTTAQRRLLCWKTWYRILCYCLFQHTVCASHGAEC